MLHPDSSGPQTLCAFLSPNYSDKKQQNQIFGACQSIHFFL